VDPYDPEGFRVAGHAVIDQLADYLVGTATGEGPVLRYAPPEASLNQWPSPVEMDQRVPFADLLPHVIAGSNHIHHPRFVGHQISAPIGSAALAELVSAVLNNGTAVFEMGPVSNAMEKRLLEWLGSALGFGPDVEGLFTSGGSAGNLTALAAARQVGCRYRRLERRAGRPTAACDPGVRRGALLQRPRCADPGLRCWRRRTGGRR
jgi:L-2,4-diaminobutyrate decarboxylase